jgi:membrane-bound lytic murein transglycosylase D
MLGLVIKMKRMLCLCCVCFLPLLTGAKELVNYQTVSAESGNPGGASGAHPGDSAGNSGAVSGAPAEELPNRPLRSVQYNQPFASRPHREAPVLLTLTGLQESATQKYIAQYSSRSGKAWLTAIVKRSEPYLAFIRSEIERRGLPRELIYLPVIESAYSVNAVSRSGATGLWQFMRNSIGPYDMRITEWMDERRDFWKSTVGALDKLENEYRRVGSWELALAAYNAGLGTVLNAQKKYPGEDYWELCRRRVFKNETIQYIPRLLAVSYILSNPRRFGLEPLWPEDPRWTRVPVGRSVDLGIVAEHAGLSGTELKNANRELAYGITPPDPTYHIKVPSAHAQAVAAVLDDPELELIKYYFHTIRSGDTLSGIARRYGVSENQVRGHNPGLQDRYLKVGQRLIIPALKGAPAAAQAASGPNREAGEKADGTNSGAANSGGTNSGGANSGAPGSGAPDSRGTPGSQGTHLVKRGETLWSIALAYNTNPETLAQINQMNLNDTLRVGSALKTP